MRICNVICDVTSGGVEAVLQNYFAHLDRSQYELDLITYGIQSNACAEKFKALGFNIIVVPPKRSGFFKSIRAMNTVIRSGNYDVIHAHLTEWNCIPLLLGKWNKVSIRISHSHMAETHLSSVKKLLLMVQRSLILKSSTKLCACGDDAAKYLYGRKICEQGQVTVLNNAIDRERFQPNPKIRAEVREELRISDSTLCIGHIGRFLPQKNHSFLIDIFNEVLKIQEDSILLLIGTGELEKEIRNKCEMLGIINKVKFLGVRSDPERLYQAMDVFCLPSLFEGLPVVGVEVQAAQIPTVVSDQVSRKLKLNDGIKFLSLDAGAKEWAAQLINSSKEVVEDQFPKEYDINYTATEWAKLYMS